MKKILLFLISLITFSFSDEYCTIQNEFSIPILTEYSSYEVMNDWYDTGATIAYPDAFLCQNPMNANTLLYRTYSTYNIFIITYSKRIQTGAFNGVYYPSQNLTKRLKFYVCTDSSKKYNFSNSTCETYLPPIPTCPTGSHNNNDISGSPCFSDFEQNSLDVFDNGNTWVSWKDGASTWCEASTGKCLTHDVNGNRIENRFINPFVYADGSTGEGVFRGVIPVEFPPLKTIGDLALDGVGNALGKTLQAFGMGIMVTGSGNGVLWYDGNAGMNLLNPAVSIGGSLFALGNALVTDENVIVTTPDTTGAINSNIIVSTSDATISTMENSTPSDGSPAFSPNGLYTYKQVTDANLKTVWDSAAGVGKLPPNTLIAGSDIIYPSNNPDKAIIQTPDKILFVETKPDNSATVLEVTKNDLANYANNNTDLNYKKTDVSPPTINPDGTTSQKTETSIGITSPKTNENTTTTPEGKTTIADPTKDTNGTAPIIVPTGNGNIDLSGVTSRLDKISNQLTKQNEFQDKLDKAIATDIAHGIPSDASAGDWLSWSTTWDNIKASLDSVSTKGDELKTLVSGGFTLALTGGTVETCPYNSTIDLLGNSIPVSFDLCKAFSPMRPVLYTMFYLIMVFSIISSSIKLLFRMA